MNPREDWPVIDWTRDKLTALKQAYRDCKGETFKFEGHEFLKAYAKYLIEYLEMEFKKKGW